MFGPGSFRAIRILVKTAGKPSGWLFLSVACLVAFVNVNDRLRFD
jgi:hypothetical protein